MSHLFDLKFFDSLLTFSGNLQDFPANDQREIKKGLPKNENKFLAAALFEILSFVKETMVP